MRPMRPTSAQRATPRPPGARAMGPRHRDREVARPGRGTAERLREHLQRGEHDDVMVGLT